MSRERDWGADFLNAKIAVGRAPRNRGLGLIAMRPLSPGEIVWAGYQVNGDCSILTWEEIRVDPRLVRYAYQIDYDRFTVTDDGVDDPGNYLNHHCAPNLWYDHSAETRETLFLYHLLPRVVRDARQRLACVRFFRTGGPPEPATETEGMLHDVWQLYCARVRDADDLEILVAQRPIDAGEEVTVDYSTFWIASDQDFPCRCGAPGCRGIIRARDYLHQDPEHASAFVRRVLQIEGRWRAARSSP